MTRIEDALKSYQDANYEIAGEEYFSRYILAKRRLTQIVYPRTAGGFREGNDHGPQHIFRVVDYLERILGEPGLKNLDPYELFLAAMSALYHDIGLLRQRHKHADISAHLLKAEESGPILNENDKRFMAVAILDHSSSKNIKKDCKGFGQVEFVGRHPVRIRLVAALVRLADELDEDNRRAPKFLQKMLRLPNSSKFFWTFNQRIQSVAPQLTNNSILITMALERGDENLSFKVDGETRPFISLAMEKIIKINSEREYCNQFFPDVIKYNEMVLRLTPTFKTAGWSSQDITIRDQMTLEELLERLPGPLRQGPKPAAANPPNKPNGNTPPKAGLLKGVSFAKAHRDLVVYCLTKKVVSAKRQKDLAREIQELSNYDVDEWVKLELLEKILLKVFGRDLLAAAVEEAGPSIK